MQGVCLPRGLSLSLFDLVDGYSFRGTWTCCTQSSCSAYLTRTVHPLSTCWENYGWSHMGIPFSAHWCSDCCNDLYIWFVAWLIKEKIRLTLQIRHLSYCILLICRFVQSILLNCYWPTFEGWSMAYVLKLPAVSLYCAKFHQYLECICLL